MGDLKSGVGAKIWGEYLKLLPPCCRTFGCIHFYMVRLKLRSNG